MALASLQSKLRHIGDAYEDALGGIVFHYFRPQGMTAFLVWQEDGEDASFSADNLKGEQSIHGTTDYFTKIEYDPVIDTIQSIHQSLFGANWSISSVQYEDETKLIHYEWQWTAAVSDV